jgi:antitoxin component YwqK of YwqJK toxin-antitoxin module
MKIAFAVILVCLSQLLWSQPKPGTIYPEGKPGVNYNLLNAKGKRDGVWIQQWKDTRNLLYKGQYKNGVPVGTWERFYSDGTLMATTVHVQDTTIVDVTFYFQDGKSKMSEGRFVKKKKEGVWKLWDEYGAMLSEEMYHDSLLDGVCKYFYESNKPLKIEQFRNGKKSGPFVEYYENGKKRAEGTYVNDEKDGAYKAWFESGNLDCEGKYFAGLPDGSWYYNLPDGKPKVSVLFKKGKEIKRKYENGDIKEYYDSGIPKVEFTVENGLKQGPFTEWYDQGQYVQVPGTKEDQEAGIVYREKLEGLQIKFHGDYVDDKLEGEVIYYRSNGSVEKIEEWSDGKLMRTRQSMK